MQDTLSPAEAQALTHRIIEEVWNQGNLEVVDEFYATNYVRHDPATPDAAPGPAGVKQLVMQYRHAFPDLKLTIEDIIIAGDKVVTRWSSNGTHQGELQGIAPTGNRIQLSGISIGRNENGKTVEEWVHWDALGMLKQLGVISA